jgi:hypothetical protein
LAELLSQGGPYTLRHGFAQAADPTSGGQSTINVEGEYARHVSAELVQLLQRARAEGYPGADDLAYLAGHLGIAEAASGPAAEAPAESESAPEPTLA